MTTDLTAARRSTRRWNPATDAQRATFLSHFRVLLIDGGVAADDAHLTDAGDIADGMDTPRSAAATFLRSYKAH